MSGGPQGEVSAILTANLKALAAVTPELVQRLHLPVDSSHLEERPGQAPRYRLQLATVNFVIMDADLERMAEGIGSPAEIFVFGISIGEQVQHLLRTRPESTRIVVWDRDPYLMRLALTALDVSDAITSGRLELHMGGDLIALLPRTRRAVALFHPFLAKVYCNELELVIHPSDLPIALLALGNLFFDDVARALRAKGHVPYPIDLAGWAPEELDHTVAVTKALYLMTVNLTHGATEFCERHALPLITWEVDPCADSEQRAPQPNTHTHIFSYRRSHAEKYRQLGYAHAEYLPLASDTGKRGLRELSAEEAKQYAVPLTFVGSSIIDSAAEQRQRFLLQYGQWHEAGGQSLEDCAARIKAVLDAQRADQSTYRIPQLAREHFGEFLAATEQRRLIRASTADFEASEDPVMLLAEIAAAEKRVAYAAALGPLGLQVWGDAAWRNLEATGLQYQGHAGHNDELTKIYANAAINVDLGRIYQMDIVTMRVFDVLACGGFLIAEHNQSLEELFRIGTELESYRSLEELEDKVRYYQANPTAADAIRARARSAITERHTIARRLNHMLNKSGITRN